MVSSYPPYGKLQITSPLMDTARADRGLGCEDLCFCRILRLTLTLDPILLPGESGAWVIDVFTQEVYGHLVAADDLGEAYAIPFASTLDNIKSRFAGTAVTITTPADIDDPSSTKLNQDFDVDCSSIISENSTELETAQRPRRDLSSPRRAKRAAPPTDSGYASRSTSEPNSPADGIHLTEPRTPSPPRLNRLSRQMRKSSSQPSLETISSDEESDSQTPPSLPPPSLPPPSLSSNSFLRKPGISLVSRPNIRALLKQDDGKPGRTRWRLLEVLSRRHRSG
jgi:hypothetical protein